MKMEKEIDYINNELNIANVKPNCTMSFHNDAKGEVGVLDWNDGVLKFSGETDEGAKVLFEYLKPYMDEYIKFKLEAKE